MQYKPKYFTLKELVNPKIFAMTADYVLWQLFDPRLLKAADYIREKYGVCFVNTSDGVLTDCGLRAVDSPTGAKYSAHKYGRALDLHIKSIEDKKLSKAEKIKAYDNVRLELLADKELGFLNYENGISWLHVDSYNRAQRTFKP